MAQGWRHFKIKVGQDLEDDKRRCRIVRELIGDGRTLVSGRGGGLRMGRVAKGTQDKFADEVTRTKTPSAQINRA